jgi:predicted nucleotidyltransferase
MEKLIKEKLRQVESQSGITILLACETGSRAWGFPSPDSDYDVRFIYCHPLDWYLSIEDRKDTIEYLEGDLDLVGWDIRKSLQLLRKSNAALFERLQSPIIYRQQPGIREKLTQLAPAYFSARAGLHHYLGMAHNYYKACAPAAGVKLKSYFYLLRTALAGLWIVEHQSPPPLSFQGLLPLVQQASVLARINTLLGLKTRKRETYLHPKEPELEAYVGSMLEYCQRSTDTFAKHQGPTDPLNDLFRTIIARP